MTFVKKITMRLQKDIDPVQCTIAIVLMVAATLVRHADCNGYSSGFPNIEASQGTIWPQPQVILAGRDGLLFVIES